MARNLEQQKYLNMIRGIVLQKYSVFKSII
jgi:hypothetical protein